MLEEGWRTAIEAEAEACECAIAQATTAIAQAEAAGIPSVAAAVDPIEMPYSVLLLYPDYANDGGTETFYAFVAASDPLVAVAQAQRQAAAAQEGAEIEPDVFAPLLVTQGHHYGEPLFNK